MQAFNPIQSLTAAIVNAYDGVLYPGNSNFLFTPKDVIDTWDGEIFLRQKSWDKIPWQQIPSRAISRSYLALSSVSSLGFRWLIPAYMCYSLKQYCDPDQSTDHTYTTLSCANMQSLERLSGSYRAKQIDAALIRIKQVRSSLSQEQKTVFSDFLSLFEKNSLISEAERFHIRTALQKKYYLL